MTSPADAARTARYAENQRIIPASAVVQPTVDNPAPQPVPMGEPIADVTRLPEGTE